MDKLTCSRPDCEHDEIIGVGVMVGEPDPGTPELHWREDFRTYHGDLEDGKVSTFLLLHPTCYVDLFDQITRTEKLIALQIAIAPVGVLKEELGLNEGV